MLDKYAFEYDYYDYVDRILDTYNHHNSVTFDVSTFTDFDAVKNRICYKLVNTKANEKLLEDVPHRQLFDLSIVYYVMVSVEDGASGSILIHNNHLGFWDVTENDLYEYASINTTLTPTTIPATINLFGILNSLRSCTAATITNTSAIMTDIISGTYPPPQKTCIELPFTAYTSNKGI